MPYNMQEMFLKYGYPNFKPLVLMAGILFMIAIFALGIGYLSMSKEINTEAKNIFRSIFRHKWD